MINALAEKIIELRIENDNLAYENKKMAEFIQYIIENHIEPIGKLTINEEQLTDIIINSDKSKWSLLIQ